MRIVPLSLIWFATLAVPAWSKDSTGAEDFTGAYAGVNAGYAFSGSDRPGVRPDFSGPQGAPSEMPPSARQASETLRTRNLRDRPGSALPR